MYISKIDGTICKNILGLSGHCKKHNLTVLEYYIKYENFVIPKCNCGKDKQFKKGITFRKTCGDNECKIKLTNNSSIYTEEYRENARQKRNDYLKKKTGKTAWERRAAGEMSYLEKWFYDNAIIKYNLNDVYKIKLEHSVYPYFIDFAFIDLKLGIEMDGRCHFTNGKERIEHDIKRDKILTEKGWKIYRIKYNEINEETIKQVLKEINYE